ncbi:hypothetical protein SPF06_03810 [Sinomonas sp. JGH33]|uniref:Uncharacterized protein n=1 Tax=Sinomonas terricola TaxID=3110330 RepID=A0ABU5T2W7_9MICC|nr:hypothetical protein [Sinomonas sp. JGH33]MEA5453839.1 hypothetical protein [Sinomonas sp. JGH33]
MQLVLSGVVGLPLGVPARVSWIGGTVVAMLMLIFVADRVDRRLPEES